MPQIRLTKLQTAVGAKLVGGTAVANVLQAGKGLFVRCACLKIVAKQSSFQILPGRPWISRVSSKSSAAVQTKAKSSLKRAMRFCGSHIGRRVAPFPLAELG